MESNLNLRCLRKEIDEYVKVMHPQKSKEEALRESFATALMIQYNFSEVE